MISSMLVAVDDTPRAAFVVREAGELARLLGARVHLLRVVDVPPEVPPAARTSHDELEHVLLERARAELAQFADELHCPNVEVIADGSTAPWKHVIAAAERWDVDLIVIGSHGYAGLDHLFGTNAGRISDRAHRHVLVVHPR